MKYNLLFKVKCCVKIKGSPVPTNRFIVLSRDSDYPHKYGPEGGCADSSVFERMKKYQVSAVKEPAKVRHSSESFIRPVSEWSLFSGNVFVL